jgi:hypothetical protein
VERNVVFNEDDVLTTNDFAIIPGDALAEGERDKVIQNPYNNANSDETNINQPQAEAEKVDAPPGPATWCISTNG